MAHQISKPIALLVEGQDYYHYLVHSYGNTALFRDVHVFDFGGVTQLTEYLRVFRATRGFQLISALGIIRDAELDATAARQKICNSLRATQFAVPNLANTVVPGPPKVGYLIMPHNQNSGCLEDACLASCANGRVVTCANNFLNCVGPDPANQNWNAKVRARAIIAGIAPGKTLGQSAAANIWDRTAPPLKIVEDFIAALY